MRIVLSCPSIWLLLRSTAAKRTPMAIGRSPWTCPLVCETPPPHPRHPRGRRRAQFHQSDKFPYPLYPRQTSLHLHAPTVCVQVAAGRGLVSRCKFPTSRQMPVATLQSPAPLALVTPPTLRPKQRGLGTRTHLGSCSHRPRHLQPPHCSRPVRLGHQIRSHGLPIPTTRII